MEDYTFPAHIRTDPETGENEIQTCTQHNQKTAAYARDALRGVGLGAAAYLAGLLHDCGKYCQQFARYLMSAVGGGDVRRGSVNHTFAGVRYILRRWHRADGATFSDIAAELLAYAAGAHHGLFDCVDSEHKSGFAHRMNSDADHTYIEDAIQNFLALCADEKQLDALFSAAFAELQKVFSVFQQLSLQSAGVSFFLGCTARLLLSAVIEGDRRDTAEFLHGAAFSGLPDDRRALWQMCLSRVEQKMKELPADSEIGRARRYISEQCRAAAGQEQGIYRLHVPTGGGKTLAGLRYALAHAQCYNKSRVVFVSPLLTILDQNARVIRDYIQDDRLILEHHANIVQSPDDETQSNTRLLTDNWGAPIIITTLVQLLNTLFSGKTAAIRRFWALCESVIVIDEIQSLPVRLLSQFNMAVSFLSEVCGATIVLCSATQPCLEAADRPLLRTPVDMVPYEPAVWECFRRTELRFAGHRLLADIPEWIGDMLQDTDSLLLVCNKKDEAGYLYRALAGEGRRCYLLSAAMCSAHRKNVLRELYAALRNPAGTKVVCVSTQVIEAGVDITFSRAVRLCAGLDNAVQTAGRCNRNRESAAPAPVYLVDCEDENLSHLPDIRRAKEATTDLLVHFSRDSARFRDDLTSSEAVRWYYRRLYAGTGAGFQDCALPRPRDKLTQYDLLSENASLSDPALCPAGGRYFMRQAFKLAGDSFEVFEGDTFDVVVPYEEGRDILCELNSERAKRDFVYTKALLSRAKAYTISLFGYQKKRLESVNGLYTVCDGAVLALEEGHYDGLTGLTMDDYSNGYQEV